MPGANEAHRVAACCGVVALIAVAKLKKNAVRTIDLFKHFSRIPAFLLHNEIDASKRNMGLHR
jgi:hypothetical protein